MISVHSYIDAQQIGSKLLECKHYNKQCLFGDCVVLLIYIQGFS